MGAAESLRQMREPFAVKGKHVEKDLSSRRLLWAFGRAEADAPTLKVRLAFAHIESAPGLCF